MAKFDNQLRHDLYSTLDQNISQNQSRKSSIQEQDINHAPNITVSMAERLFTKYFPHSDKNEVQLWTSACDTIFHWFDYKRDDLKVYLKKIITLYGNETQGIYYIPLK